MKIKKIPDSDGTWVSADGLRYTLLVVRRLRDANGVNVGFEEFTSLADALERWNLRCDNYVQKNDKSE